MKPVALITALAAVVAGVIALLLRRGPDTAAVIRGAVVHDPTDDTRVDADGAVTVEPVHPRAPGPDVLGVPEPLHARAHPRGVPRRRP
jgi:hypothetical protein